MAVDGSLVDDTGSVVAHWWMYRSLLPQKSRSRQLEQAPATGLRRRGWIQYQTFIETVIDGLEKTGWIRGSVLVDVY